MSKPDGGTAFPVLTTGPWRNPYTNGGMTLRDYFAGQALHDAARIAAERLNIASGNSLHDGMARCAYEIADAMLEQRAKP